LKREPEWRRYSFLAHREFRGSFGLIVSSSE
jgi:hypothetical protein